jgi:NADH dehydrogenase
MGKCVARNICLSLACRQYRPFRYVNRGMMATIGRSAGIADLGRIHLRGFVAWLAWLLVHLYFLIGFRNRIVVLFSWAWSYFTYQRGARLITGRDADIRLTEKSVFPVTEPNAEKQTFC